MHDDEATILRRRLAGAGPRPEPDVDRGNAVMAGTVVDMGHMPATVPGRFAVQTTTVSSDGTEGGTTNSEVVDEAALTFVVLGPKVPEVGDVLVARLVDDAWVTERGPAGCAVTDVFHVGACNRTLGGVVVTFTKGGVTRTGTSDVFGFGSLTVTFPSAGRWNYSLAIPGDVNGYIGLTGTVVLTCTPTTILLPALCSFPKVLLYNGSVTQAQSAFYFINIPGDAGLGINPGNGLYNEPGYTLTFGARPAEIPKELQLLYYSAPGGVVDPWYVTMPDEAWFSTPIDATIFGVPTHVYFYAWRNGCDLNVMVIDAPYGFHVYGGAGDTKGAGNNVIRYNQTSCAPFQMKFGLSGAVRVGGTHGTDDVVAQSVGQYTNPRHGL